MKQFQSRIHSAVAVSFAVTLASFSLASPAMGRDNIPNYEENSQLLATVPSADEGAIGAMFNPAAWGIMPKTEFDFFFSDQDVREKALDNWGFAVGSKFGFSFRRQDFLYPVGNTIEPRKVLDYQIGLGGEKEGRYYGTAFGWSGGDKDLLDRKSFLSFGYIRRPSRALTYGTTMRKAIGAEDFEFLIDGSLRPFGTPFISLFTAYDVRTGQKWNEGYFEVGTQLQPIKGIWGSFKLQEAGNYRIGVGIALRTFGGQAVPSYKSGGDHIATNYIVRVNPPIAGADLDGIINRNKRYMTLSLAGRATYQKFRLWDTQSKPLLDIVRALDRAEKDPTVDGVAINIAGFVANPTMLWEIREKLASIKEAGKGVVVYSERFSLSTYYFATVADRIIMNPEGFAIIPGVQMSRTYMKETLAKIGIGFDEWRYFKYKSAYESFSRESMSEADREQREAMLQQIYDEYAGGIVASGRMSRVEFDSVIEDKPMLMPPALKEMGWIDEVAHWDQIGKACKEVAGHDIQLISAKRLAEVRWEPRQEWGPAPEIAVVYAVGPTSMNTGIRARTTSQELARLRTRKNVKAIVVRADSPGGDPIAAELVANEIRKTRKAGKPVFVSQGRVAASGGYWISMDGEKIASSPFTYTGSIGVIGGWAWDQGFADKLGLTSDQLQIGKSADLLGGLTLPYLGIRIPERNLTDDEKETVKASILEMYDNFTRGVAEARNLSVDRVREIAEGRVYMGRRAEELNLVDTMATLEEMILEAKYAAGIQESREIKIREYPPRKLFRWPSYFRSVTAGFSGIDIEENEIPEPETYQTFAVHEILRHPGHPMVLTPGALLPAEPMVAH